MPQTSYSYLDHSKPINIVSGIIILSIIHIVSIFGIKTPSVSDQFVRYIPYNILASLIILLYYQKHWNPRAIVFLFVIFLSSFIIETIGKDTQLIFGPFAYQTATLYPKLFGTPLIIGVYWLVLIYSIGCMVKDMKIDLIAKCSIAGLLMVLFDILLEPIATQYYLWRWTPPVTVPFQNYIAWFVVSFFMFLYFFNLKAKIRNPIAPSIFIIQFMYLVFMSLF